MTNIALLSAWLIAAAAVPVKGDDNAQQAVCACPLLLRTVCALQDGELTDFDNECQARCVGATVLRQGSCNCRCNRSYKPVCGADGKTYNNRCKATCAQVDVEYNGACQVTQVKKSATVQRCVCTAELNAVCGSDGNTYSNPCLATCSGVTFSDGGACPDIDECACDRKYDPVCSTDNVEYGNRCQARCNGAQVLHEGRCAASRPSLRSISNTAARKCICTLLYEPVCGANGRTYVNRCAADCVGEEVVSSTACVNHAATLPVVPDLIQTSQPDCICPAIIQKVCDPVTGQTYISSCVAKCSGVNSVTLPPCVRAVQPIAP